MKNKWKEIWEKRSEDFSNVDMTDPINVFMELKRIDGFDVIGGGIPRDALIKQHDEIVQRLFKFHKGESVFEVGCGSGADLFLLADKGYKIGGMDYSSAQIAIAEKILKRDHNVQELICDEAINVPVDIKYDAVFSNSVFSYFQDEAYAAAVMDRISEKTRFAFGIIDVHDVEKKEQFEEFRKASVENYEERYKELKKLFYSKEFFLEWAKRADFDIEFYDSDVEGYWNSEYVFDVYLYRK